MGFSIFKTADIPDSVSLTLARGPVAVSIRHNARAKSYRLTVTARGEPVLTIPKGGRWREAEAFLDRNTGWLEKRLIRRTTPYALLDGGRVPVRGTEHRLRALDISRGTVRIQDCQDGPVLLVPGGEAHMRRRLIDWLKAEARADLDARCTIHAANLGVQIAAIKLRDQSTRWGSCSSTRTLSFNWRLVMAPPHVLDYVAAHEVAHILEMNHAPAFWTQVEKTLPGYGVAKSWLKHHGAGLMAIG